MQKNKMNKWQWRKKLINLLIEMQTEIMLIQSPMKCPVCFLIPNANWWCSSKHFSHFSSQNRFFFPFISALHWFYLCSYNDVFMVIIAVVGQRKSKKSCINVLYENNSINSFVPRRVVTDVKMSNKTKKYEVLSAQPFIKTFCASISMLSNKNYFAFSFCTSFIPKK